MEWAERFLCKVSQRKNDQRPSSDGHDVCRYLNIKRLHAVEGRWHCGRQVHHRSATQREPEILVNVFSSLCVLLEGPFHHLRPLAEAWYTVLDSGTLARLVQYPLVVSRKCSAQRTIHTYVLALIISRQEDRLVLLQPCLRSMYQSKKIPQIRGVSIWGTFECPERPGSCILTSWPLQTLSAW